MISNRTKLNLFTIIYIISSGLCFPFSFKTCYILIVFLEKKIKKPKQKVTTIREKDPRLKLGNVEIENKNKQNEILSINHTISICYAFFFSYLIIGNFIFAFDLKFEGVFYVLLVAKLFNFLKKSKSI